MVFQSRPDLLPPQLQIVGSADPVAGNIFLTPVAIPTARGTGTAIQIEEGLGQPGVMMLDPTGELLWFEPVPGNGLATNLQVQTYDGQPALTYWEGASGPGIGFGKGYILDSSYQTVATIEAGNGLQADLHELTITPQDTALITAYVPRAANLSAIGGSSSGTVYDSVVQEIDIKTGKVLLEWRSLDHVPVTETQAGLTASPFDYFHVNSVSLYTPDELLISSRNTWTLYRVDRHSGTVIGRIGGKSSNYSMGAGTTFYWQHHARAEPGGFVSVFDDGSSPPEESRSRGLLLAVDDTKGTVSLLKSFTHPAGLLAEFEGSMQPLSTGGAFVGWGDQPYFSELAVDGAVVFDGRLPTNAQSYRAMRSTWIGQPSTPPDVAVAPDGLGGTVVFVSWNGATQVASWQVLCGDTPAKMSEIANVPRAGFETAITTRPSGKLLAVAARDLKGQQIGISETISV